MDPIVAAVKQLGIENDRERVQVAARMLPLAPQHYSLAMRLLSGTIKPAKGGATTLVFASDFTLPALSKPE